MLADLLHDGQASLRGQRLNSGKRGRWLGRTRTGARPLRGRVLYPSELRAIGGPGQIRTGVTQLCRLVPGRSVTGPRGVLGRTRTCVLWVRNPTLSPLGYEDMPCVPGDGIEPPMPKRRLYGPLQYHSANLAGRTTGLEPATARLTTELLSLSVRPQCAIRDSNPGHAACDTAALPTELIALGAPGRTRTCGLPVRSRARYPLRHKGMVSAAGF